MVLMSFLPLANSRVHQLGEDSADVRREMTDALPIVRI
jgi:hypothetical protein